MDNYKTYGLIYGSVLDISCPQGWHVATVEEWLQLVNYSGGVQNAGRLLKSKGTDLWAAPNEATNETNFSVLPEGNLSRFQFYDYSGLGTATSFWAASTNYKPVSILSFWDDDFVSIEDARYFQTGYCRCV
ncbi:hypothetical protein FK220_007015 [Flavobacteriaceae bacterium TP-CH-4]|uniref:Fibrobacter succinogenes major paralogous domain-containing protein n=1 Tax=Pelagihabitans pacificus TaxID=2696054 RepID=A0A967AU72_9FLAO|nr:hypothetical protein [Pelagihabitans pacificus]